MSDTLKAKQAREIEFRAWDGEEMHYKINDRVLTPDNLVRFGSYMKRDLKYMEYIGLNDKNGTKIYEGDIVKIPGTDVFEIKYANNQDSDIGNDTTGFDIGEDRAHMCEVIGNIYEDPKLLEEEASKKLSELRERMGNDSL